MAALELDRDRIEKLLGRIADRLSGDWVLLGGALAAVWFHRDRVTEDIDLVSIFDVRAIGDLDDRSMTGSYSS